MAQVECISAMMVGMKARRDQIALAAETLYKMFDKGEEELVSQVKKFILVHSLAVNSLKFHHNKQAVRMTNNWSSAKLTLFTVVAVK
jgi:uncharacterized membrane protein YgdD (TMEM256/DUF423 family)